MTLTTTERPPPGLVTPPLEQALADLPNVFGTLLRATIDGSSPATISAAIARASAVDSRVALELDAATSLATKDETARTLQILVASWPNASQNNLSIYSAQLALAVREARPSTYALSSASRHLIRTSRFLPSIAEVLEAVAAAEARLAGARKALDRLPEVLAKAQRALADATARDRRDAAWRERRVAMGGTNRNRCLADEADIEHVPQGIVRPAREAATVAHHEP